MTTRIPPILCLGLLLGMAGAACGDTEDPTNADSLPAPAPSVSASPTTSAQPADVACVIGSWRVTGVRASGAFGTTSGRVAGGTGAVMTVNGDGVTAVDFTGSEPVSFSGEFGNTELSGQIQYAGSLRAAVRFEQPTGETPGTWRPQTGTGDNRLRATVKLSEPFEVTLLDDAPVGELTGTDLPQTGDALDVLPILRGGTYSCTADALQVQTRQNGPTMTWLFNRTR
ncbi:hypothetical protein AB0F81_50230 [Actinoplanes sp. NPDC024001]|uniref:hypothetical protein n=1 Tax=Actinoplanes sp. NPDC024001 TaxID=3154598 RepID=UPI0033E553E2